MKRSDYWKCPKCKAINDVDCNYCECEFKNNFKKKKEKNNVSEEIDSFSFPEREVTFDGFY